MASKKAPKKKAVKAVKTARPHWIALQSGDIVDVVAPGFCPTDDEVEAGVQFLESWGLKPRLPHDLFGADVLSSNTDEKRLKHITQALLAKDSTAIWCLRGGYGSNRLVPGLMKVKKPKQTKVLLGLSDVTTIQQFLELKWKWPSLQTPVLCRMGTIINPKLLRAGKEGPIASQTEELRRVIFGETSTVLFEGLRRIDGAPPEKSSSKKASLIRGTMTGGNLMTYASAIGTAIHPNTEGSIVYFEEVGERGYRIDRLLEHLVQSGVLNKKTKAVVFGEFIGCVEPDGTEKYHAVLERFASTWARPLGIPVFTGIPSGHGLNQRVVPLGTDAVLDLSSGSLEIETAVQHARGK